jgi:hypothetical protein
MLCHVPWHLPSPENPDLIISHATLANEKGEARHCGLRPFFLRIFGLLDWCVAAVNQRPEARDVARLVRRQEHDCSCDLADSAQVWDLPALCWRI